MLKKNEIKTNIAQKKFLNFIEKETKFLIRRMNSNPSIIFSVSGIFLLNRLENSYIRFYCDLIRINNGLPCSRSAGVYLLS